MDQVDTANRPFKSLTRQNDCSLEFLLILLPYLASAIVLFSLLHWLNVRKSSSVVVGLRVFKARWKAACKEARTLDIMLRWGANWVIYEFRKSLCDSQYRWSLTVTGFLCFPSCLRKGNYWWSSTSHPDPENCLILVDKTPQWVDFISQLAHLSVLCYTLAQILVNGCTRIIS